MSRPIDPTIAWKVRIDAALAAKVELALMDAARKKPKYGGRKGLIEALLTEWLQRQAEEGSSPHA
jgi:hypothetical protein